MIKVIILTINTHNFENLTPLNILGNIYFCLHSIRYVRMKKQICIDKAWSLIEDG